MVKTFRKIEIRHKLVNLKVTLKEYEQIKAMAEKYCAGNMSAWIRAVARAEPSDYVFEFEERDDDEQ